MEGAELTIVAWIAPGGALFPHSVPCRLFQ
jgi:hypothetical protein